jgi:4-hydroxy-4-methyl-2-oxoglutarate aldolase
MPSADSGATGSERLLTAEQLAYLEGIDSPTIANAIEAFKVRDRCEGFIGGTIRDLSPALGVMVGWSSCRTSAALPAAAPSGAR